MVKIMMVGKTPHHKLNESVKTYMRTDKPTYPDFLKKLENWIAQITDDRLKSYAVYECPDDKIVESMAALAKRYNFYASVEGYTYTMELLTEADAAIKDFLKK